MAFVCVCVLLCVLFNVFVWLMCGLLRVLCALCFFFVCVVRVRSVFVNVCVFCVYIYL